MSKEDIVEEMLEHNRNVEKQFQKAQKGEVIDLTAMMISKEKIQKKRGMW
jgi:hypothetical protein